ncbi:MAG: DUF523 and DUF1722 domain-containing protein [Campylobacterota bacterium]|nr:DUF523 and DUF1722 domain-containing protein [Campylobacterota bacterium]
MKIGISSCLLGDLCRYDGSGCKDSFVVDELSKYFELMGYCPEEPVFGTPRDTIRLVGVNNQIRVHIVKSGEDVTDKLLNSSMVFAKKAKYDDLCGFVLKSKSPTCGLERVKVYEEKNAPSEKKGIGLFANELQKIYPNLPIEEEGRLNDPWLKENFLMQVFAYGDIKKFLESDPKLKELVVFHTSYKYLIFAKSEKSYRSLGGIVANHEKLELTKVLKLYQEQFLKAINEKSNIKKTYNVLQHITGYFKKLISKDEKEHLLTACNEYKGGIIPLIAVTKLINLYVKRFDNKYLKSQKFLNPYPKELSLRSDIKAYKW